ncbi:MAG: UMP kinase [Endomicrobiia bacterium]|nr:UMP kinase [Endomicrobiaceae bacterium]MDD3052867.1 UMP kinase [Endomicrobiaceae bacterium]MDD3922089.1 UMP kinase [Endomicrobiaceae bacterium]MDD5101949.1 UMP kinase [Endomicrobiaceae bacterium]
MKTKRVLLKLSGEALSSNDKSICSESLQSIVEEIKPVLSKGIELSIVVGAGNIWRGAGKEIDRVSADKMGMLATTINAIALSDILKANNIKSIILSASGVTNFCDTFSQQKAEEYLSKGYVVVFAGGTGNPFFTTDTTAALRASEIKADVILKATQVNGIYTADPKKNPSAIKYDKITYQEAIDKKLKIMDISAFLLCMENNIAIYVFDFHKKGNLLKMLTNQNIGTIVS